MAVVDIRRRWRGRAGCQGVDPGVFFNDLETENHTSGRSVWRQARRLCGACPVLNECARDTIGEPDGFWGGRTPHERVALRRYRSMNVHRMPDTEKRAYVELILKLQERDTPYPEMERLLGLRPVACRWLLRWWNGENPPPFYTGDPKPHMVTPEEKVMMRALRDRGYGTKDICATVGRSPEAIARVLGIQAELEKLREAS